jgi:hypothetical protein
MRFTAIAAKKKPFKSFSETSKDNIRVFVALFIGSYFGIFVIND